MTLADGSNASKGRNSVFGDMLVLVSGLCYAAYTVAIRKLLHNDSARATMLFFGYIGLLNAVVLAPLVAVLLMSVIDVSRLNARILSLAVGKGEPML